MNAERMVRNYLVQERKDIRIRNLNNEFDEKIERIYKGEDIRKDTDGDKMVEEMNETETIDELSENTRYSDEFEDDDDTYLYPVKHLPIAVEYFIDSKNKTVVCKSKAPKICIVHDYATILRSVVDSEELYEWYLAYFEIFDYYDEFMAKVVISDKPNKDGSKDEFSVDRGMKVASYKFKKKVRKYLSKVIRDYVAYRDRENETYKQALNRLSIARWH